MADKRNKKQQDSDFIAAYQSEYPFILKLCAARLGGNMDLAEDCAQDAFYILYKKTVSGVTVDNPRAFLAKTANLIVLNRRTKRTAEAARQADLEDMADSLSDGAQLYEGTENRDLAARLCQALSETDRQLFQWRYMDELSVAEIAERSGSSITAVTSRLSRLRKRLQNIYQRNEVTE
ncbi:MAG: sigma-70 family RNA polymerase sigma factor [Eubacterium sp.]|nr:sigma-70 family RNA polymerase sigma factor [Eubacterium sp.]